MVPNKMFKTFDESILDQYPVLKDSLKPNDRYPELENVLNKRYFNLPSGSFNSKVIICQGKIVKRVYETPKGQVISLSSKSTNLFSDNAA